MSWSHQIGKPCNKKRALPPDMAGRKPIPTGRYIKKNLLLAALKMWEIRKGIEPDPELVEARLSWKRRKRGA